MKGDDSIPTPRTESPVLFDLAMLVEGLILAGAVVGGLLLF